MSASGNDVRDQARFERGHFVAQPQLALFQPRKPQLVGHTGADKRFYRRVQVAVFELQGVEALGKITVGHARKLAGQTIRLNGQIG